ncbi:MAG: glycerol kinase GlpK [Acutalibacteraceae bacterium]|nr:glycerol kinase GlpK [Acutalibacteraceae bacterium]
MKKYVLSIDEGTTSARAILFDNNAKPISVSQHEFTQIYPKPSYVEHDPMEIYSAQVCALTECITRAGVNPKEIAAVGITNQRETVIVWDKTTGKPIYNAVVWQCRRTADICEDLKAQGFEEYIIKTTGLKIDAYFSATKIKWILDNVKDARQKAEKGQLLFGTVDTWLIWKLSGGKIHITDYTNASRTMLFDIHNLCWDNKLLQIFGIPESMLPTVKSSSEIYGEINILGENIPVSGIAGDQQAALFGQRCFTAGDIKNTYGTGCFLLMNTGHTAYKSNNGLLTTVAASFNGNINYALEGSVFVGGAVIQWLRDELGLITDSAQSEECATAVENNGGVYIVPAFTGLGAPYWDMYAKGTVCGLTRGSNKNHLVRAALESIAYQTNDLLDALSADTGITPKSVLADGGAANNRFLMQFQADISSTAIICPISSEATALGAAFLAGLAVGFWKDMNDIKNIKIEHRSFTPSINPIEKQKLLNGWKKAVCASKSFCGE